MNREDIIEALQMGLCNIKYTKVSGETREAVGTLVQDLIPVDKMPKTSTDTYNVETVRYYDMNSDGWRSFRVENIVSIEKVI